MNPHHNNSSFSSGIQKVGVKKNTLIKLRVTSLDCGVTTIFKFLLPQTQQLYQKYQQQENRVSLHQLFVTYSIVSNIETGTQEKQRKVKEKQRKVKNTEKSERQDRSRMTSEPNRMKRGSSKVGTAVIPGALYSFSLSLCFFLSLINSYHQN